MNIGPLKEQNSSVESADPLVAILYGLVRDHIPCGQVEKLVCEAEAHAGKTFEYSNGHLAYYAIALSRRIRALYPTLQKVEEL